MLNYIKKSNHRRELERYLKKWLPTLSGCILDIGSKSRRYDFLLKEKPVAIDIAPAKEKDIEKGDINNMQFKDGHFDSVMCIEVLEYVSTPQKAISEIYRVLKKDGTLILSAPFMYKDHGDKIRFTEEYLRELLAAFSDVKIHSIGNYCTVILDILRDRIRRIKFIPLRFICYPLYLFLTLFIPFSKRSKDENYASGNFIMARK